MYRKWGQGIPPEGFHALEAYLPPEAPTGVATNFGESYACAATGPLSIVNVDKMLLAAASKIILPAPRAHASPYHKADYFNEVR